jgi:hypothetical protein
VLGPEKMSEDFYLYAFGFLPFFEYCATSTKSLFIEVVSKHILPIANCLSPCLPTLISSFLPGLEEEASEFFPKSLAILLSLEKKFAHLQFLESFISVFVSNPRMKAFCITYINRRPTEELGPFFNLALQPEREMYTAFVNGGLDEENLIVIRGTMDHVIESVQVSSKYYFLRSQL